MLRLRFPAACLASAAMGALALIAPAYAQSAPDGPTTKIEDIQVSRDGETVSILVKLSQQPSAATVKSSPNALALEIDGVTLAPLSLSPPAGSLVTGVSAGANRITLSGAALGAASTTIYRNAVLIEAKLSEPALANATSLLTPAGPAKTIATPPAHPAQPTPPEHPAPVAQVPVALTPASPTAPITLATPGSAAAPANDLQSHPAAALLTASIAGVDAARCNAASSELEKDAWALGAMGDRALCLLDAGKFDEAKSRLDQLAAITPLDWRVALGLAALHDHNGEKQEAQEAWLAALDRAPTDTIRDAIRSKLAITGPAGQ